MREQLLTFCALFSVFCPAGLSSSVLGVDTQIALIKLGKEKIG